MLQFVRVHRNATSDGTSRQTWMTSHMSEMMELTRCRRHTDAWVRSLRGLKVSGTTTAPLKNALVLLETTRRRGTGASSIRNSRL